jgi:c-di-AMP phosphodiesterase-like protein
VKSKLKELIKLTHPKYYYYTFTLIITALIAFAYGNYEKAMTLLLFYIAITLYLCIDWSESNDKNSTK